MAATEIAMEGGGTESNAAKQQQEQDRAQGQAYGKC